MKLPPCKSPNHPKGVPRDRGMIVLEENANRVAFACVPCRDIEKILSVQIVTLPKGWAAAKYQNALAGVERAKQVVRGREGKIKYFH